MHKPSVEIVIALTFLCRRSNPMLNQNRLAFALKIFVVISYLAGWGWSYQATGRRTAEVNQTRDAVVEAQTSRETPVTRPEQRKTEHDRSNVFKGTSAKPSSPAFENQPDQGKVTGFDFARDPLNAKKPMETFEEIMRADVSMKAK